MTFFKIFIIVLACREPTALAATHLLLLLSCFKAFLSCQKNYFKLACIRDGFSCERYFNVLQKRVTPFSGSVMNDF